MMSFSCVYASGNAKVVPIIGQLPIFDVESHELPLLRSLALDSPETGISKQSTGVTTTLEDSLKLAPEPAALDSLFGSDSTFVLEDSVVALSDDSLVVDGDSLHITFAPDGLDAAVDYNAQDSIIYDLAGRMIYLYGDADITYENINLKADYIEFNWGNKTVSSWGKTDSAGNVSGKPVFTDKSTNQNFTSDTLRYNFESQKGKIYTMTTREGEGYIKFTEVKRNQYEELFGEDGWYTTCDHPEPHYYLSAKRIKAVPDKLMVTGPAKLVIEGVPTPLVLPFGLFPLQKGKHSGILIPQYGESQNLGFFLKNGGYYWAMNDYYDLKLTGDIYTRGSWRLSLGSNYRVRYRYSGNLNLNVSTTRTNFPTDLDFRKARDFFINWSHSQDAKARPNQRFSASVRLGTNSYQTNNTDYTADFLSNSFSSNINWSRSWAGKPYTLSLSARHNQSTQSNQVDITLPEMVFNVTRIFPFERKVSTGDKRWYEQIGLSYKLDGKATVSRPDSLLFEGATLDRVETGLRHTIPVSTSFKVLKYFALSPSFSYTEIWVPNSVRRNFVADTLFTETDTTFGYVQVDTIPGFKAARWYNMSVNLSTRMYGKLQFKGKLKAIRHVMTPTISFSYRPDFSEPRYSYYGDYVTDFEGTQRQYSIFENSIFGGPPSGRSGSIGVGIQNQLEMKVFNKKDTVKFERKIKLLESFGINGSYNLAADSFRMSNISMSGRTTLFDKINLNFGGTFDPYFTDSSGRRRNVSEWKANRRLLNFKSGNIAAGTRLAGRDKGGAQIDAGRKPVFRSWSLWEVDEAYADFSIPWSLSMNYNLRISNQLSSLGEDSLVTTQTLGGSLQLRLTPKWNISTNTTYDFRQNRFSTTTVNITRDLHCWQMSFAWIPFGIRQSYALNINVKSAILKDLKFERRKDWFDDDF